MDHEDVEAGRRSAGRVIRFERALVRIRWFGIAFGVFQVVAYNPFPDTEVPTSMHTVSGAALAVLAAANGWVLWRLRHGSGAEPLTGRVAFAADLVAIWGIIWAFSFEEFGATWVILAFAAAEGAARYQLRGAMLPVASALVLFPLVDLYRSDAYGFAFYIDGFTFRLGFIAIIAGITGVLARNLERERSHAEERATELEELAQRERTARAESTAFQEVILAGVAAIGMQETLQRMIEHIAEQLGYDHIAVLMVEDQRLSVVAMHGFSPEVRSTTVAVGEGIAGHVAATGRSEIVADVTTDPRYFPANTSTRSQVTVPIRTGEQVIGVLDCESHVLDAFTVAETERLERLAAQMGLVIENARLLSQERAMVERLRELDQMRSDFIAIASHELRTPLTAIQGSIKTLRRTDIEIDPEDLKTFLAVLDRQSERLTRLVEDLLMVSHIDAGGISLTMTDVEIRDAMDDVLAELGSGADRVSVALPPSLSALRTDGHRLRQIVRNLLDNALKFSPDDSVVRVTLHHAASRLTIEVADEGRGMTEADMERIFERFYQVGGSLRRHGEGFGLGLYITRRLVDALGGSIDVSSEEGSGSTFRVSLPAVPVSGQAAETA